MALGVTRVGDGQREVVLLHGFLGSRRNLLSLARSVGALRPDLTLRVLDLPGHGEAPPLAPGADLDTLARAVLDELGGAQVTIVGHSLGGRVGLAAHLLAPDVVPRVLLLDIAPGPITLPALASGRVLEALLRAPAVAESVGLMRAALIDAGLESALVEWLLMSLTRTPGRVGWRIDRAALAALHPVVNARDLWRAVEGGRLATACLRGSASPYVSAADSARLEAAGCPVTTLAGAGHFVHVDAPHDVADFVARQVTQG
ncbi:MAG: alpha/beta hydrolase [Myxococcales bacterium]|nr:alpha/beta hydrolase [Myxococcales bacterium]